MLGKKRVLRGKMGAGIPYFVLEEGRFHGLGLILRFGERQPLGLWELCIWTIRFSQNSGWQTGIEPPPSSGHRKSVASGPIHGTSQKSD